MKNYKLPIQFGPYPAHEAEQIVEEYFHSKEASCLFEQLIRGDISWGEYSYSVLFLVESIHASIKEKEREIMAEASHEPYLEEV